MVRLERVAEELLAAGTDDFAGAVEDRLRSARESGAVGAKSIAAYRVGLELPAARPSADEFARALADADPARLVDRTVSGWLAHMAVELGLPLQFHVGYGDSDLDLLACDPLRLTAFLRATQEHGVPVLLLHNWPYHRHAAYLAQVFDHVFMDLGLTCTTPARSRPRCCGRRWKPCPSARPLSTDAYGLAELYHLGALLFRRAMSAVLGELVDAGETTAEDAAHAARLVGHENAQRAYAL